MTRRLLFLATAVVACEGSAPKPVTAPRATAIATIDTPPLPPIAIRDAGAEAAPPSKDTVGPFHIIAISEGAPFRMHRLGEDVIVRAGQTVAKLDGEELTSLPSFFDGVPAWEAINIGKDKAFNGWNPPHDGDRSGWQGVRRIVGIFGTSLNDVWLATERGHYQMWVGEAWRRTGANTPFKLAKDLGSADRTWAAVAVGKSDALLGIVHPYADNGDPRKPMRELYRAEAVGSAPKFQLAPPAKNCLANVYPQGFVAFPSGDAMLYGQKCSHLDRAAAVARWDARGAGPTIDTLPSWGKDNAVSAEGVYAYDRDDVWVFGGAMMPHRKDETEDPPTKAYLAHFDGKKWSIINAPDADPITHLVKMSNGSLAAFVWPTAYYTRDGANARWVKNDLHPDLSHVRALAVWFGKSDDLFVAGSLDLGNRGVVLHPKPAKTIFVAKDEYTGD